MQKNGSINAVISWLLEGDVALQYQTWRDLLGKDRTDLQSRISSEGWGLAFLSRRKASGHWGKKFYQPKWTSTHYTLLDLKHLNISKDISPIRESIHLIVSQNKSSDGGINPAVSIPTGEVCVSGMFLNYASYFNTPEGDLKSVVDFILGQKMPDGGFNCWSNRSGAVHSSMHTTLSVMEGLVEFLNNGYDYKKEEIVSALDAAREFLLIHRLFRSDRSGKIIHPEFLKMRFPRRWKYNILSALDLFQHAGFPWDKRMSEAMDYIAGKKTKDGKWKLQAKLPGATHFDMEKAGFPSRWNTLRALRIQQRYAQSR